MIEIDTSHAVLESALFEALGTAAAGLTEAEAARRLTSTGPNRLPPARSRSTAAILRDQFRGVVVWLLLGAVVVAWVAGEHVDAAVIFVVLLINGGIGFATDWRATRAVAGLATHDVRHVKVLRDGIQRLTDAVNLVPGDVFELSAGQRVPADGRILEAAELRVDEAPLTGESIPVSKRPLTLPASTPLADRANMVYVGTTVMTGLGRVLATATGAATEYGRIGTLVNTVVQPPTPLERRLDVLGRQLSWAVLVMASLYVFAGVLQGVPVATVLETAIALAVAAVPEALPAVATMTMAVGVHRMARRGAVVRRLAAVESLGAATIVCTDKTRTLTAGDMRLVYVWTPEGETGLRADDATGALPPPVRHALRVGARASLDESSDEAGRAAAHDPVDRAVRQGALDAGIETSAENRIAVVPFSNARRYMAAFDAEGGRTIAFVKGAPSAILDLCTPASGDAPSRARLEEENERLAGQGLRVLALAAGAVGAAEGISLRGLTFVGFIGLQDPPAAGVKDTIATLRGAGLRTIMVTGDQALTAAAVARELGLETGESSPPLTGAEIASLEPAALAARLAQTSVCSRVSPEQKLAIVEALQKGGHIVAMLGDGINDAAALRRADVGVAMGRRGTDVARDAAAMVLADDRFVTIGAAVEEGRIIFDNIRKFVFYLFSCNLSEVLVLVIAALAGWPIPLLPLQLLWLNLVTDTLPALALGVEPGDPAVMRKPPRSPDEALLSRGGIASVIGFASVITAATLGAFAVSLPDGVTTARTVAFMTLAFAQILHLGTARSDRPVVGLRDMFSNRFAIGAVVLAGAAQCAALLIGPLPALLGVAALDGRHWLTIVIASVAPAVLGQVLRAVTSQR